MHEIINARTAEVASETSKQNYLPGTASQSALLTRSLLTLSSSVSVIKLCTPGKYIVFYEDAAKLLHACTSQRTAKVLSYCPPFNKRPCAIYSLAQHTVSNEYRELRAAFIFKATKSGPQLSCETQQNHMK
jgi:hypothetical protein